ncbi:MAG: uracil-DNA glycosylase [Treponema sp.]|nr:uracil-DNA glycosylase [Treponema sp.]
MTKTDKECIYTLLKTASDAYYGFSSPDFSGTMPAFADDIAKTKTLTMNDIAKKIHSCMHCQLCKTRTHAVPGEGVLHPVVLVIGEGPGAEEDNTGRPFVGPAGQLLDKMLAAISLDRHKNCFIGNIVKCRPPHNRDPEPIEADACASFLQAQIHALKPAMILAVGRIAAQNLLKTKAGISALRNTLHMYNTIPLMATYHPSALLRNADLKRPAWEDLKLFRSRLESIVPNYASFCDTDFFSI